MSGWSPAAIACLIAFVTIANLFVVLFMDANNPLAYLRTYRRAKGGVWQRNVSLLPGVPTAWERLDTRPYGNTELHYAERV